MSDFKVVRNVVVVNSRLVTPVQRDFGQQYSLLASSPELAEVGGSATKDGSFWLNANAQYPNGDSIAPIPMVNRAKQPVTTELGEGSEIEIAFRIVHTKKGTFHNLAAIKVLKFVKPFSILDVFDDVSEADVLDAF